MQTATSPRRLTFGSLFAGIGGLDLGLHRAGFRCRWQVERDPYCRSVLARHWPRVPRFDDVRTFARQPDAALQVDLICGGFPCQDISNLGKRAGLSGARSGLWREYRRILETLSPRYVLIENVAALRLRGLDQVLRDLASLGYDAEWQALPAAAVGARHIRDRLFIVAFARGAAPGARRCRQPSRFAQMVRGAHPDLLADACRHALLPDAQRRTARQRAALSHPKRPVRWQARNPTGARREVLAGPDRDAQHGPAVFPTPHAARRLAHFRDRAGAHWVAERGLDRLAHGLPRRLERERLLRLRCLGNSVVPQVAEFIGLCILAFDRATR